MAERTGLELAAVAFDASGAPRSLKFDDVYFSRAGGLDETREVFLKGCGLPEAWAGRDRFVGAELGFGTGLNMLALLQLWRDHRPAGARLNLFSVEAFPLAADAAARALDAFPDLAGLAQPLLRTWPAARGFHRIDWPEIDATLDLAVMEAVEALQAWRGWADAWLLDGFAPSRNPDMWRPEVLRLVALRSAAGARAATYTVAGQVRRGLQAAGFEVARRPGFGGKRERLEATRPSEPRRRPRARPSACILGAGIAGAALCRAFAAEGLRPLVIDAAAPAGGASGNPSALATPRLDASGGAVAQLHAQAFARAVELIGRGAPEAVIARGVLQLEGQPRDGRRFDTVAQSPLFAPGALERLDAAAAGGRLGEAVAMGGLWIADGLTVEPEPLIRRWLEGGQLVTARVAHVARAGSGWRLTDADGATIAEGEVLALAAGWGLKALLPAAPLQAVRGQASFCPLADKVGAAAWGGYLAPTRDGILFGATHDRDQTETEVRGEDQQRNLDALAKALPALAARLDQSRLQGRAGVRATTPDRLPLAGTVAGQEGLLVLGGLGGRGFTLAPLLAEHLAAEALGAPSPVPGPVAELLTLDRFTGRSAKPAQPSPA